MMRPEARVTMMIRKLADRREQLPSGHEKRKAIQERINVLLWVKCAIDTDPVMLVELDS